MKRIIAILGIILAAGVASAQVSIITTNYFPAYVGTDATFADAGDTGLTVGKVYACFCLDDLSNITAAEISHTNALSDVREVMFAIDEAMYLAVQSLATTNRPDAYVVSQKVDTDAGTNVIMKIYYTWVARIQRSDNDFEAE